MKNLAAVALVAGAAAIAACGVNPVTGKREIQFVSEASEISIGEQVYLSTQQADGGAFAVEPDVGRYVARVGRRLAAVSDRPGLPYEFTVVNSSEPNAWTLPGGKVGVNRGLLLALDNEAELAAVLGHEIVHAAARHPAKQVERGTLLQVGLLGLGIALGDRQYSNLIVGGAAVGAGLVNSRYGRDQELEADRYGMKYMAKAGYDPSAAVTLQEKFVKLFEGKEPGWLTGLFASHPPSAERVEANRRATAELPAGGDVGRRDYEDAIAGLARLRPAYAALDEGREALAKGDERRAISLASKAIRIEPREALFYGLRGDASFRKGDERAALDDYDEAIERNPRYFQFYVQRGLLAAKRGDTRDARRDLGRSIELLPTAPAHYALGELELAGGSERSALEHFRAAASSSSEVGRRAAIALAELEIPDAPGRYVGVDVRSAGVALRNQSPIAIRDVVVELASYTKKGHLLDTDRVVHYGRIEPGAIGEVRTRLRRAEKGRVEARVVRAEAADRGRGRRGSRGGGIDLLDMFD